jgi:hypothetical protein
MHLRVQFCKAKAHCSWRENSSRTDTSVDAARQGIARIQTTFTAVSSVPRRRKPRRHVPMERCKSACCNSSADGFHLGLEPGLDKWTAHRARHRSSSSLGPRYDHRTEGGLIGLALIAPFLQSSDKPLAVPTLGTAAYLSPAPTAPRPAQLVRAYQNDR